MIFKIRVQKQGINFQYEVNIESQLCCCTKKYKNLYLHYLKRHEFSS